MKDKKIETVQIEYHADDYAMFPRQSCRILECRRNGRLNGVSIMPNSECLDECMSNLYSLSKDVAVSVHLNLIEGHSLCRAEEVPLLTNKEGILSSTFGKLLLHSFLPGRNAYRHQLKKELSAQICAVRAHMAPDTPLRIDSHAHYHMIPVVFDALMDVILEENLNVQYMRIPKEYPMLYLRHLRQLRDFSYINLVKVMILNILSALAHIKYHETLQDMEQKLFLGVFLSGRMHYENVSVILPDAVKLAKGFGMDIELLAHPGGVFEPEDIARITHREDKIFLTSEMRNRERSAFLFAPDGGVS